MEKANRYLKENKRTHGAAVSEMIIDGNLRDELLNGATIIAHHFDGFDHTILIKRAKEMYEASKWEYAQYGSMFNIGKGNTLALMATRNGTQRGVLRKVEKDYYEDRGLKHRICESNEE